MADDSQIYLHCFSSEIHDAIVLMQQDAQAIWAIENVLELNIKKSNVLLMGSEAYIRFPELNIHNLPPILMNNKPLNCVELVKNRGFWLTPNLDCTIYVENILNKVHMSIGSLQLHRKSLSFPLKK